MFMCIPDILDSGVLAQLREAAGSLAFEDGAATAGWHAKTVKKNTQAAVAPALRHAQRWIIDALEANDVFRSAALPRRIAPPLISLYRPGDSYGGHVDDAVMGLDPPLRSDLSVTVFIADPQSYEGGELVVETAAGEDAVKLEAGGAVVYPSTTLHRVEPVTEGERLVAVTWVQSLVRDQGARDILFDLDQVRRAVFAEQGKGRAFDLATRSYANLLRRWADV
jgi:PKHD-type hydroxylase